MIARNRSKIIVIMLTSSEKSLLFIVSSQLFQTHVIVIIVSLIVLKQDLIRQCLKWKVLCVCYDSVITSQQLHAISSLLLMNINRAITLEFLTFARVLHATNRLNRIVLNETHLLLTIAHYRSRVIVVELLRRIFCLFVCMTITLLSFVEQQMKQLLQFTYCETLRVSNDRFNLTYQMQILFFSLESSCDEKELIDETIEICMKYVKR